MKRKGFFIIFLLFIFITFGYGDNGFFLLQEGIEAFNRREYGNALTIFRSTSETAGSIPEAEYWIGRIFEQEGEYRLALEQYKLALSQSDLLYIPEDKYTILYRMARIQELLKEYNSYEETLKSIIALPHEEDTTEEMKQAMVSAFQGRGLDRYFILFRSREKPKTRAFGELGLFYYRTGRYREASEKLIFAITIPVSVSIDYLRERDPDYEFFAIDLFFEDAFKNPTVLKYLQAEALFKYWYYLGSALYAQGDMERSREVWNSLVYQKIDPYYSNLSKKQIQNPSIEPVLQIQ